ncbi:MAG: methylmalonyl Co-A mutase-associated GTPase MeaB [Alphaproteobacteria bacterium]|nr:methylmalonyl Co-A mutase-associated GTPase MeaB [Alphaproteobacteria bacterium]
MTDKTKGRLTRQADDLVAELRAGGRTALGRAITAVENDRTDARPLLKAIRGQLGRARVIGVTGAPGVGKSSLLNALIREHRQRGETVGVVAVDPSSPLTGGAILGDRIRMSEHGSDAGVFVRSLASRGHLGGLSRAAARVVDVMDAAGLDLVIVETVGTGQSEVEIMDVAQTVLVVCAPGLGDEIQALKAGILEIADILVINKADMPLVDKTESQLRDALSLTHREGWQVPVLRTVAPSGEGVAALADRIAAHHAQLAPDARDDAARLRVRRLLAAAAGHQVRDRLARLDDSRLEALCEAVLTGERDLEDAAVAAAAIVVGGSDDEG